ncbi:MAG: Fur family transcriptional regulator [bacterium]
MGSGREGKALAKTGDHNHQRCVAEAMHRAEAVCKDSGARMTSLRRMVLEQVWRGHDAVKAYDILAWLGRRRPSAKPPTVYRALQFLQEEGLVHRLESLNAFVGCSQPRSSHQGQFLICGECGQVSEMEALEITRLVSESARDKGFIPHRQTIEVHGVCGQCA